MSNLRVILPSGAVVSVDYVKPIAERVIKFNGSKRRFTEEARNMKLEANGVRIREATGQGFGMMGNNDVIVGNLKNEQVQEIIRQLNEKGYYDFSQFDYQKVETLNDLKLGSKYPPYNSENNVMLSIIAPCNPFGGCNNQMCGGDIFSSSEEFDDCDDSDYDEEGDEFDED